MVSWSSEIWLAEVNQEGGVSVSASRPTIMQARLSGTDTALFGANRKVRTLGFNMGVSEHSAQTLKRVEIGGAHGQIKCRAILIHKLQLHSCASQPT